MAFPLFHICPRDLNGLILHPLSDLQASLPQVATHAWQKYVGREWLPEKIIPTLCCRWMDVVFFVPVRPADVRDALISARHPRFPRRWIEIDAEQLTPDRTAIFLPGDSTDDDSFASFDLRVLASHSQLSAAQRAAYAQGVPGKTLLFARTAHVLHRGSVQFDPSRIVTV